LGCVGWTEQKNGEKNNPTESCVMEPKELVVVKEDCVNKIKHVELPGDCGVALKETEKYQDLKPEIALIIIYIRAM